MSIDIPLDQMSLSDKLELMERIWADISQEPADLPSPAWHKEVLDERRRLATEGKLKFQDWETMFAEIREELRGDSHS